MDDIVKILQDEGFHVVEGKDAVKNMIKSCADFGNEERCSGYRVFPGGKKCEGCPDCTPVIITTASNNTASSEIKAICPSCLRERLQEELNMHDGLCEDCYEEYM